MAGMSWEEKGDSSFEKSGSERQERNRAIAVEPRDPGPDFVIF